MSMSGRATSRRGESQSNASGTPRSANRLSRDADVDRHDLPSPSSRARHVRQRSSARHRAPAPPSSRRSRRRRVAQTALASSAPFAAICLCLASPTICTKVHTTTLYALVTDSAASSCGAQSAVWISLARALTRRCRPRLPRRAFERAEAHKSRHNPTRTDQSTRWPSRGRRYTR